MLVDIELVSKKFEARIKNKYTNGKFVTIKEYDKLIRKIKLEKIKKWY